jgi:hypothetical protein
MKTAERLRKTADRITRIAEHQDKTRGKGTWVAVAVLAVCLLVSAVLVGQQAGRAAAVDRIRSQLAVNPNARDPSYLELITFLAEDSTKKVPYSDAHVCVDFALDLQHAAENSGWRCFVVLAFPAFPDSLVCPGHAFNAFTLDDGQTIFVEPQRDFMFESVSMLARVGSLDISSYVVVGCN